ncbi:MAG: O-antigen polymerase [Pyrinomonadaceae bacterium]
MYRAKFQPAFLPKNRNTALLLPVLLIAAIIFVGGLSVFVLTDDTNNPFKQMYLLPWSLMVGAVIAAPSVYLFYKGRFNLFHPIVFAAWSYFFPAFFLGSLILASGLSQPYFLTFIEDERYNLPLTMFFVALGYGGLSLGFFLPFGKNIGKKIDIWLPNPQWKPEGLLFPGLLLLAIGLANVILGFVYGILGYQRVDVIGAYDGLLFLLTLVWFEASFLLWLCIFRTKKLNVSHYLIIGLLITLSLTRTAYQGNRGGILQVCILVVCAFVLSGKQIRLKYRVFGGIFLTCAVIIGIFYGTAFRTVKESEAQVGIDEYTEYIFNTFDKVLDQDAGQSLEQGFTALAERLDAVSTLAVVVSNYEKLAPFEESYGLDNNIWNDSIYFFIPRPLWVDKPVASDAHKYGDLYFNYSENAFAITPMGDLLRNYGPIGVPLGMIFLGFIIRIFYAALIENQDFSFWRATLFYMFLMSVSYESFYGIIIPYLVRVGFISVIGLIIVWFFAKSDSNASLSG